MNVLSDAAKAARVSRIARCRRRMEEIGVDALLLSHGADLRWLTGYQAMPLERLTMLVMPRSGEPVLVVPGLEAPRVGRAEDVFTLLPWSDTEDPVDMVRSLLGSEMVRSGGDGSFRVAISDRAWADTVLSLQRAVPDAEWVTASTVTSVLRSVKDEPELNALRAAGAAADRVAAMLQSGRIALIGRTEAEVSRDLGDLLIAEGHERVNFAIVASGPNAASPHHQPGARRIERNETVVCDFGGTFSVDGEVGYCSDITRTIVTGTPCEQVIECYAVLLDAQQAAVASARAGAAAEDVDRVARSTIDDAGFGDLFVHRTGHGIGIEEHEHPYLVSGNRAVLQPGHAFSVEPGIYAEGRFGMRLEDIVVIDAEGNPDPLNAADHALVVVDS
jgi:Xaa-Pro aminopeptidase